MFDDRNPAKNNIYANGMTYQTTRNRLTQLLTYDLLEAMGPLSTTVDPREFLGS